MSAMWQDFRYGAGRLMKAPTLAIVAVLTLGLAVGANSLVYSLLDTMFFRPMAVEEPDRLARLYTGAVESPQGSLSYPDFEDYQSNVTSFSGLIASSRRGALLRVGDVAEQLLIEVVSRNYFDVLQVAPAKGRFWRPDVRDPSDEQLVMISHDLWQRHFAGDPEIVGKPIDLSRRDFVIGGVLPETFRGLDRLIAFDVWISFDTWSSRMNAASEFDSRGSHWLDVWGRLAPGATVEQARAEAELVASRLSQSYPETNKDLLSSVVLESDERQRRGLGLAVLLMSLAGLVLLVCCANIANLLLAQSEGRRREMATRSALGASRLRIARQVIAESLLLAAVGGTFGLLLAAWLVDLLPAVMPQSSVRLNLDFGIDVRVSAFTCFVSILATVLFGGAPALRASRVDLMKALRGETGLGTGRTSRLSVRNVLVVGQVAACVALLTASGLLTRSLLKTAQIDPGFERKAMILLEINPSLAGLSNDESLAALGEMTERLGSLPGVRRVSYALRAPLSPSGGGRSVKVFFSTRSVADQTSGREIKYNAVDPNYFATIGTRVLRGRGFEARDRRGSQPVVLISETMARRFWSSAEPIGDAIRVSDENWEIVGVVEDAKIIRIHEPPEPYLYFAFAQRPRGEATLLIETRTGAGSQANPVREALRSIAPDVPVLRLTTQNELMRYALYSEHLYARLASGLGILGLLLAATGLFGVISYLVRQRTNEIGIRMALGARRGQVLLPFVTSGLVLSSIGVAVGSSTLLAVAGLFSEFLYGVSPTDPLSFVGAAGVVMLTAASASYLPARAAARVDPVQAMRCE